MSLWTKKYERTLPDKAFRERRGKILSLNGSRYGYYRTIRRGTGLIKACAKKLGMEDLLPEIVALEVKLLEGLSRWYWTKHETITNGDQNGDQ